MTGSTPDEVFRLHTMLAYFDKCYRDPRRRVSLTWAELDRLLDVAREWLKSHADPDDMCGDCIHFLKTAPPINGATLCYQKEGHDGPHVGAVAWSEGSLS
jgi:hypothetical protein